MNKTVELLGDKAEYLLSHTCKTIDKSTLHLPSPHTVEEVWAASDLADAVATAVINKRAGGMGLISGRKAFQRPMNEGIELLHAIQDVYLDPSITIA